MYSIFFEKNKRCFYCGSREGWKRHPLFSFLNKDTTNSTTQSVEEKLQNNLQEGKVPRYKCYDCILYKIGTRFKRAPVEVK